MEKKFTPKFFYIKKTFKYLYAGQTTKDDVFKYTGSGLKWSKHLKKEGIKTPETIVWVWCESPEDFQKCLDYYLPIGYVESNDWANLVAETPWDCTDVSGFRHSSETINRLSSLALERIENGTHNKIDRSILVDSALRHSRTTQLKRIKEGTHNFIGDKSVIKMLQEGKHHTQVEYAILYKGKVVNHRIKHANAIKKWIINNLGFEVWNSKLFTKIKL